MTTRQGPIWRTIQQFLAGLLCVSAASAGQKPPEPIGWSLKMTGSSQSIKAGGVFKVQVEARIEQGWHLYSTEQPPGGPKPTRITLAPDQVFEADGTVESPAPLVAHDENFDIETEYYEDSVVFTMPVRASSGAPAGTQKLKLEIRFQSCTNQLCLPPKTVKLDLSVEIIKSG